MLSFIITLITWIYKISGYFTKTYRVLAKRQEKQTIFSILTKILIKYGLKCGKFLLCFFEIGIVLAAIFLMAYSLSSLLNDLTFEYQVNNAEPEYITVNGEDIIKGDLPAYKNKRILHENFYNRVSDISYFQTFNMIDKQERLLTSAFKDIYENTLEIFVPWIDWDDLKIRDANGIPVDYLKPASGMNTAESKLGNNFLRDYYGKESRYLLSPTLLAELNKYVFEKAHTSENAVIKYPEQFKKPVHFVFDYYRVDMETGEIEPYQTKRDSNGEVISKPSRLVADYAVLERNAYEVFKQRFESADSIYDVATNNVSKYGAYLDEETGETHIALIYYLLKEDVKYGEQVKKSDVEAIYATFEDFKANKPITIEDDCYVLPYKYSSAVTLEESEELEKENNNKNNNDQENQDSSKEDELPISSEDTANDDLLTETELVDLKVPVDANEFPRRRYQLVPLATSEDGVIATSITYINSKEVTRKRLTDEYRYSDEYIKDLEKFLNEDFESYLENKYTTDLDEIAKEKDKEEEDSNQTNSNTSVETPSSDDSNSLLKYAYSAIEKHLLSDNRITETDIKAFHDYVFESPYMKDKWEYYYLGTESLPIAKYEEDTDGQYKVVKNKEAYKESNFRYVIKNVSSNNQFDLTTKTLPNAEYLGEGVTMESSYYTDENGKIKSDGMNQEAVYTTPNTKYYWNSDTKQIVNKSDLSSLPLEVKSVRDYGLGSILSYIEGRRVQFRSGVQYDETYNASTIKSYFESKYAGELNSNLVANGFYPQQVVERDSTYVDNYVKNPEELQNFITISKKLAGLEDNIDDAPSSGEYTVGGLTFCQDGGVALAGNSCSGSNIKVFGPYIDPTQTDGILNTMLSYLKKTPSRAEQFLNPKKFYLYWFDKIYNEETHGIELLGSEEIFKTYEKGVVYGDNQVGQAFLDNYQANINSSNYSYSPSYKDSKNTYFKDKDGNIMSTAETLQTLKSNASGQIIDFKYTSPSEVDQIFMIEEAVTFAGEFLYSYEDKVEKIGTVEDKRVIDTFYTDRYFYVPSWNIKANGTSYSTKGGTATSVDSPPSSPYGVVSLEDGEEEIDAVFSGPYTSRTKEECHSEPIRGEDGKITDYDRVCEDVTYYSQPVTANIKKTNTYKIADRDQEYKLGSEVLQHVKIYDELNLSFVSTSDADEEDPLAGFVTPESADNEIASGSPNNLYLGYEVENAQKLREQHRSDYEESDEEKAENSIPHYDEEALIYGKAYGNDKDYKVNFNKSQKLHAPKLSEGLIKSVFEKLRTDSNGFTIGFEPDGTYDVRINVVDRTKEANPMPLYRNYSGFVKEVMPKELEYYYNGESYVSWLRRMTNPERDPQKRFELEEADLASKKYIQDYLLNFEAYIPLNVKSDGDLEERGFVGYGLQLPTYQSKPNETIPFTNLFIAEAEKDYWRKIYKDLGLNDQKGVKMVSQLLQGLAEELKTVAPDMMMRFYDDIADTSENRGKIKSFDNKDSLEIELKSTSGENKTYLMTHVGLMSIPYFGAPDKTKITTVGYGESLSGSTGADVSLIVGGENDDRLDAAKSVEFASKKLARLVKKYNGFNEAIYAYYTSEEFMDALMTVTSNNLNQGKEHGTWTSPTQSDITAAFELMTGEMLPDGKEFDMNLFGPKFVERVISYMSESENKEQVVSGAFKDITSIKNVEVGSALDSQAFKNSTKYLPIIEKYAAEIGVDPYLVLAMISQESGGHNISSGAAWGVMQIEDVSYGKQGYPYIRRESIDGKEYSIKITKNVSTDERLNLEKNIEFGCVELKARIDNNNGDVLKGLFAYNMGQGAANKLFNKYPNGDEWMDHTSEMPALMGRTRYGDTKYLSNVLRYYAGNSLDLTSVSTGGTSSSYGQQYKDTWDKLDVMIGEDYQNERLGGVDEYENHLTFREVELVLGSSASYRYENEMVGEFEYTVMDLLGNPMASSDGTTVGSTNGNLAAPTLEQFASYIYNIDEYVVPLDYSMGTAKITSGFGVRNDPFGSNESEFHKGIDLAEPIGTKVYSIAPGKCIKVRYDANGYGHVAYIAHPIDPEGKYYIISIYPHMNSRPLINEGDYVQAGTHVGYVGSSGSSTGPHLHFEIRMEYMGYSASPELMNASFVKTFSDGRKVINPFYFAVANPTQEQIDQYGK